VLLERLGIAAQVKSKTITRPGGFIGGVVASGEAELAIQQVSELLAVPGIELVGLLPDAIQQVFITSVAVFADARAPASARALIEFAGRQARASVFEMYGLEAA